MSNQNVKQQVQNAWINNTGGLTKAAIARKFGISERSVGRYISEITSQVQTATTKKTPAKPAKLVTSSKPKTSHTQKALDTLNGNTSFAPQTNAVDPEDWKPEDEAEDEIEYRILATLKSISITKLKNGVVDGNVVVDNKSNIFQQVFDGVRKSGMSQEYLAEAYLLMQPAEALSVFSKGKLTVDGKKREITYVNAAGKRHTVHNNLSTRIIQAVGAREPESEIMKLATLLDAILENTSYRAVNGLYDFLKHNDIEITERGTFYAWKVVRSDYTDCHTGTMDNSVGTRVEMDRNMVDEDPERTCSAGLHVCARAYIGSFYTQTNRVVKVEVHPRDVVAIPRDYNGAKMRTCGYDVIEDVTNTEAPKK